MVYGFRLTAFRGLAEREYVEACEVCAGHEVCIADGRYVMARCEHEPLCSGFEPYHKDGGMYRP